MKSNNVIVGNNIAALVTALELSRNNHNVTLINPLLPWGAHFGGLKSQWGDFDYGMNLFEFTSFAASIKSDIDPLGYNPLVRNDVGRFMSNIEKYVTSKVRCIEVPSPQMYFQGTFFEDLTISNHFEILNKLPENIKAKIKQELVNIIENPRSALHASNKITRQDIFLEKSYEQVSVANHGKTFHDLFIEPICNRILNLSASKILALYHRVPWGPLFYPETLISQFTDNPQVLPKTKFYYPLHGSIGSFVDVLLNEVKNNQRIKILNDQIAQLQNNDIFRINMKSGESIEATQLTWCLDLPGFLKATGENSEDINFDKASVAMLFLKVTEESVMKEFSTLYLADDDINIYRITNQTVCNGSNDGYHLFSVEFVYDKVKNDLDKPSHVLFDKAVEVFKKLRIFTPDPKVIGWDFKNIKNALVLPTFENYESFVKIKSKADSLTNGMRIDFLAQSSAFLVGSLNDNIIQGLKVARKNPQSFIESNI